MATEEGWHTVEDGQKLYTKTWKTNGPAKARVVFLHGFSDHCNTYDNFFPALASHGIEVYAFDQRGWGRTVQKPSEKGLTGPTSRVLEDLTSFLRTVIPSPAPLFLVGHSMGGGEVLHYAARGPAETRKHIRGYLFIAPFIDFSPEAKPTKLKILLGRLASKFLPYRQLVNPIDINVVSRDPTVRKVLEADDLCHETGTLEGLSGLLDRTMELSTGALKIPDDAGEGGVTRIWVGHGTKDALTNYEASKRFFDTCITAKDREFKTYDGHFHRLHDEPEPDRQAFLKDITDWILARSVEPVQTDSRKSKL